MRWMRALAIHGAVLTLPVATVALVAMTPAQPAPPRARKTVRPNVFAGCRQTLPLHDRSIREMCAVVRRGSPSLVACTDIPRSCAYWGCPHEAATTFGPALRSLRACVEERDDLPEATLHVRLRTHGRPGIWPTGAVDPAILECARRELSPGPLARIAPTVFHLRLRRVPVTVELWRPADGTRPVSVDVLPELPPRSAFVMAPIYESWPAPRSARARADVMLEMAERWGTRHFRVKHPLNDHFFNTSLELLGRLRMAIPDARIRCEGL